jgi:hypothetical protein
MSEDYSNDSDEVWDNYREERYHENGDLYDEDGQSPVDETRLEEQFINLDDNIQPGRAYQIHNVFTNINDNMDGIIKTMGGKLTIYPLDLSKDNFFNSMKFSFYECFLDGPYTKEQVDTFKEQLLQILEKLWNSDFIQLPKKPYDGPCDNIFTWHQFVLRQPPEFQSHYIECYIKDTYNAYNADNGDGISCIEGIYERMLTSIGDACVLYCTEFKKKNKKKNKKQTKRKRKNHTNHNRTQNSNRSIQAGGTYKSQFRKCENPIYRKLIKLFKKEIPDINDFTQEWSRLFDEESSKRMSVADLKTNFIIFMNRKYSLYGLNNEKNVAKRAEELEQANIFENREFG